jgi:hypothetical protein
MFKDEPKIASHSRRSHLDKIKCLIDYSGWRDLPNNIKKCIKEDKIDFVIMGTAGANGWIPFMGTNTGL